MPALYPEAYSEFNRMLDELEPEVRGLKSEKVRNFLTDMIAKNKQYGERVFVSPAQLNWIKNLHAEYVGNTAQDDMPDDDGFDND